jgi:hypothetical protein
MLYRRYHPELLEQEKIVDKKKKVQSKLRKTMLSLMARDIASLEAGLPVYAQGLKISELLRSYRGHELSTPGLIIAELTATKKAWELLAKSRQCEEKQLEDALLDHDSIVGKLIPIRDAKLH